MISSNNQIFLKPSWFGKCKTIFYRTFVCWGDRIMAFLSPNSLNDQWRIIEEIEFVSTEITVFRLADSTQAHLYRLHFWSNCHVTDILKSFECIPHPNLSWNAQNKGPVRDAERNASLSVPLAGSSKIL